MKYIIIIIILLFVTLNYYLIRSPRARERGCG